MQRVYSNPTQGASHLWYPTFAKAADIPILIVYYEDLKEDVIPQMKRVHNFFQKNFNLQFEDRNWRLQCMLEER